jgi:uncharacterized Zn finger protein (UPF0148 family)
MSSESKTEREKCRRDPHDEPQHLRVKSGMVYCPDCQEIISWVGFELEEKLKQRGMKEWKYESETEREVGF